MRVRRLGSIALLVLLLCATAASAQSQSTDERRVGFGVLGGINITSLSSGGYVSDIDLVSVPPDSGTNFSAGFYATFNLAPHVYIEPGVMYSGRGGKGTDFINSTPVSNELRVHYLAVPILGRVAFKPVSEANVTPYVLVGPEIDFKMGAGQTVDFGGLGYNTESQNVSASFKSTDYAIVFGGGVDFKPVRVEARYIYGLSDVAVTTISPLTGARILPETKNRAFSVLMAIRIK